MTDKIKRNQRVQRWRALNRAHYNHTQKLRQRRRRRIMLWNEELGEEMPTKRVPAKQHIAVYLTLAEIESLDQSALENGLSRSEWVRTIILRYGLNQGRQQPPHNIVNEQSPPLFDDESEN